MWPIILLAALGLVAMSSKSGRAAVANTTARAREAFGNVTLPHAIPPLGDYTARISSAYGPRTHPVTGQPGSMHTGVDLPAPVGTPVYAPVDSIVTRLDVAGVGKGVINGNCVHMMGEGYSWAFLHLSKVYVAVGDRVSAGTCIGLVGTTGRSTGPHLHLQVAVGGEPVNPKLVLNLV